MAALSVSCSGADSFEKGRIIVSFAAPKLAAKVSIPQIGKIHQSKAGFLEIPREVFKEAVCCKNRVFALQRCTFHFVKKKPSNP